MASESPTAAAGGGGDGEPPLKDIDITEDGHGCADGEDPKGADGRAAAAAAPAEGGAASPARMGKMGPDAGVGAASPASAVGGEGGCQGVVSPPPMSRNSPRGTRPRPPEGLLGNPMDGVGEDERPYNYICNLDKVNLGGPGWFNDVFKVSVEVDTDRTWVDTLSLSLVPRNVFRRHCPLLDTTENITGTVTVEGPASKRVWLSGVSVTFEEHLMTVDSDTGELVGALEAQVATGQFIKDKAVFNFNLDLGILDNHRQWPVRETYVGDLMALRHRLMVSAQRPWYTFNVYSQIPLAMEYLSCAPDEDAGQDNEEGGPNHILVISDCNGRCDFDFGVDSFNLDDVLQGTVRFTGVTSPIVAAHLMILRAEFLYGEASEVLVAEHTILGETRKEKDPATSGLAGLSEEEQARQQFMSPFVDQKDLHFVRTQEEGCRIEAVAGDVDIAVEVPLHTLPLTPSHMSLTQDIAAVNDEAELVGVRYYIRLVLEDGAQQAYWHTHEIFFHRAGRTLSSQGLDDVSSNGDSDACHDSEGGLEPTGSAGAGDSNGHVHGHGVEGGFGRSDVDAGGVRSTNGGGGGGEGEVEGEGGGARADADASNEAQAAAVAAAKAVGRHVSDVVFPR